MKKIFILTGEPSGDMLASKVIAQLKSSKSDIEYLSVGGEHLKALNLQQKFEFLSLETTFDANLSPEGSPVKTNIFFI